MKLAKMIPWGMTLIFTVTLLGSCGGQEKIQWQSAESYFTPSVFTAILDENTTAPSAKLEKQVRLYELRKTPPLVLVDFNAESLCGQLGCAYALYGKGKRGWQRLWMQYLNPHLPADVPLLTPHSNPPGWATFCLDINQLAGEGVLRRTTVCWDGREMQEVEEKQVSLDS